MPKHNHIANVQDPGHTHTTRKSMLVSGGINTCTLNAGGGYSNAVSGTSGYEPQE